MTTSKNQRGINWIQEYVAQQQNSEAPDEFHLWTAVSTVAGALGRKVWFDMGNHLVVPNFYIVFVSPPGIVQKSTTIGAGKRLLKQLDGIHFGPDTVTWQAITDTLMDCTVFVDGIVLSRVKQSYGTSWDFRWLFHELA